jgi:hypothetical protein
VAIAAVLGSAVPAVTAVAATRESAATPVPAVVQLATAGRLATAARPDAGSPVDLSFLGDRISCASPTACLAIGSNANASAPIAEALHGTAWKSVAVTTPKGATGTVLTGVSCKAVTYCLVIGAYVDKDGATHPAAWTWNGTALTLVAAPAVPKADFIESLAAVSCVAVKSCVAIGSAESGNGTTVQFVWTWNGSKWALKTAAMPGGAKDAQLTAAHCFSLTSCVVGGSTFSGTGTFSSGLVLATWNGRAFTPQQAPQPKNVSFALLADVACFSPGHCVAVGENATLTTKTETAAGFAEVWNGKTWAVTNWAGPKGATLAAVLSASCTTATSCVAVGAAGTQKSMTASSLIWNGTHWSVVAVPSAGKGLVSDFQGVSCPKTGTCVAIGEFGKSTAVSGKPLAGYWNGKSWKIKAA